MNIAFYAAGPKSGLACNGGSKTIIRSAETLKRLGHGVCIVAKHDSFNWFRPEVAIVPYIPDNTDVVVAVSVNDIKDACKTGKKTVYWMRGIELWKMSERKIVSRCKMVDKVIVNATHLKDWLMKHNIRSEVCFAGLDLDYWKANGKERDRVGGLVNYRHSTKNSDLVEKFADVMVTGGMNDNQLRDLYSSCRIWFAPTTSEGFHNPPAEANLCGALVVCNKHIHNGMGDYATDNTAMRYTNIDEALECVRVPDFSKVQRMQKVLREKIGDRVKNMRRFVELCS